MHSPTFPSISTTFSHIRTSLRLSRSRSNSNTDGHIRSRASSTTSSAGDSYISSTSATLDVSPIDTLTSILARQRSFLDLQEERRSFGCGLDILEPRPMVYWSGLEERMEEL